MRELLLIAGAGVFAMAIVAGSVVVGHDTTTFVSPPEAVVEDFVRQLAAGRYDRGVRHLEAARIETSRAGELVWTFRLRRGGGGWKIVDWSSRE